MNLWTKAWPPAAAILSGALLALCYPRFNVEELAWVWMLPLLGACWLGRRDSLPPRTWKRAWYGFAIAYLAGVTFFLINLSWFHTVTSLGAVLVALYLGVYFAFWGAFAATIGQPRTDKLAPPRPDSPPKSAPEVTVTVPNLFASSGYALKYAFLNAAAWTALEWLRGVLFTGFPWNGLGVALHDSIMLIQIADIVGVTGLSFMLMFCGSIAMTTLWRICLEYGRQTIRPHADFAVAIIAVLLVFFYGFGKVMRPGFGETTALRAVLIQPNISINEKWDGSKANDFYRLFDDLTSIYAETGDYDLIIWPETALQQEFFHPHTQGFVNAMLEKGDFTLVFGIEEGAPPDQFYNSVALVRGSTADYQLHRKIHLVPFGEYVPLRDTFPPFRWIAEAQVPLDFNAGDSFEPLVMPENGVQIVPLVCFEDTLGDLVRRFVRDAPQLLVNVTNDGWFLDSPGSEQHLVNAKFRCVELRRPMARAANTGVSGFIDPLGNLFDATGFERLIQDTETGTTFITGTLPATIEIPIHPPRTVYARIGDLFSKLMLAFTVVVLLAQFIASRRRAK